MYRINVAVKRGHDGSSLDGKWIHFFAAEIDGSRNEAAAVLTELTDRFPECEVSIDEVETTYHGIDPVKMADEYRAARAEKKAAEFARIEKEAQEKEAQQARHTAARTELLAQAIWMQANPGMPLSTPLAVEGLRVGDTVTVEYPKLLSWRARSHLIGKDKPMLRRTYTVESLGGGYTLGTGDNREEVAVFDHGNMRIEITTKGRAMGEVVMDGRRYRTRELYSRGKVLSVKCPGVANRIFTTSEKKAS